MSAEKVNSNKNESPLLKFINREGLKLVSKKVNLGPESCSFDFIVDRKTVPRIPFAKMESLLDEIFSYKIKNVPDEGDVNFDARDCSQIAIKAEEELSLIASEVGTIYTYPEEGQEHLPFFVSTSESESEMDFDYHAVNYAKVADGLFIAFDLTSQYNIFSGGKKRSVLCVIGSSVGDLEQKLRKMYNSVM